MPEYGRHIHEMVDSLMQIEDRRERNRQARAVIAVMGNLNPLLRDTADFTHKLWDHLFIMSDFQLDVDSPYPQPSRQELTTVPRRMPYSSGHIEYKHYGKYVERMIRRLADEKNPQVVSRTVDNLARYMRTKSYEYNQEHPNNEVIIKDIKKMSGNAIQIDEVALNNIRSDYKQPFMAHPQKVRKVRRERSNGNRRIGISISRAISTARTGAHGTIPRNRVPFFDKPFSRNMRSRFFISIVFLAGALLAVSCHSSTVKISGRIVGSDCRMIYLEQVTPLAQTLIDSAQLDETGNYKLELCDVDRTPALYNLVCNGDKIPLFLQGGDRLTVSSVGRVVHNYTVEGSEESELLRRFYQPFVAGMQRLDALSSSPETYRMTDEEIRRIESEYWAEYRRIKHEQIKFIVEHKSSLAGVYALYQRLPGETYLFNLDGDVIYYRMVAEAIEERYPESSYLPLLASEIARMDARQNLMSNIAETNFPDVELPDMFGRKVRLSSLQGKVVLVDFWSAELGNSNAINAELKEVYAEYADRGFEIYQIGVDVSKDIWINAVQEQQLPWISVCDFRGRNSPALGLYNVQKLPANFLIDREGIVVARDLYGTGLQRALEAQFE